MTTTTSVAVIGASQVGLAVSHLPGGAGVDHVGAGLDGFMPSSAVAAASRHSAPIGSTA